VLVTAAPRFIEKAALFPGSAFVIGYDTAERLVNPRYYANEGAMVAALASAGAAGTLFVVAGRATADGRFLTLDDLLPTVSPALRGLFIGLTEGEVRLDVSSTELRARDAASLA